MRSCDISLGYREMSQLDFVLLSYTAFGLDVSVYSADFHVRTRTKCSEMSFYWLICQCFGRPSYYCEALI